MGSHRQKNSGLRLSPWLKFLTTMVVGLLANGLRGSQTETQSGLILSEQSLESDQPFKSSYMVFAEAASTYQSYAPPSLPALQEVESGDLPMPLIGECPSPEIKYELTRDIQAKLAQLRGRTESLVKEGKEKREQVRQAYHDFFVSPGTPYYFYEAKSVGVNENMKIQGINREIQNHKNQMEEEITVLRQAAGC